MERISIWILSILLAISLLTGCTQTMSSTQGEDGESRSPASTVQDSAGGAFGQSSDAASAQDSAVPQEDSSSSAAAHSSPQDGVASSGSAAGVSETQYSQSASEAPLEDSSPEVPRESSAASSHGQESVGSAPSAVSPRPESSASSEAAPPAEQPAEYQKEKDPAFITVTLSVDCRTAVDHGSSVAAEIAPDGILLNAVTLTLEKGANVFDALQKSGLVVGSQSTSMGRYVYAIQSLAEKACGSKSGWMYSVNGVFPNKSCDKYLLGDGDVICWRYTCDNGKDL